MSQFWDERYQAEDFVYGKNPNAYFSEQMGKIKPGLILLPGEGEGRNAVYAASKGWLVDAFDQSRVGQNKALTLAREFGVEINYKAKQLEDFHFIPNHYDAVGLLFFHATPATRTFLHKKVIESLKPGGTLILEGFHKEQLSKDTGGPRDLNMLFDQAMLSFDFSLLKTMVLNKQEIELSEGSFHRGVASVIRFLGLKPK